MSVEDGADRGTGSSRSHRPQQGSLMRAFVITGPTKGAVHQVDRPNPDPGEVVIEVDRVGVCGTDTAFFRGTQPYFASGGARYPLRIGHEWCGRVSRLGAGVDPAWLGKRVTGDTMLGCQECSLCRSGRQHVCEQRSEVGVLNGWHGALADELLMPQTAIYELPDSMSDGLGALVEPASLSLRCVDTLGLRPGDDLLVWGLGAVGLLVVAFAVAAGIEVHGVGRSIGSLDLARSLGASRVFRADEAGRLSEVAGPEQSSDTSAIEGDGSRRRTYRGAIAASPAAEVPRFCLDHLEPSGHLVLVGISGEPSLLESRNLVVGDVTVSGLLSGSPVFARTIDLLASGAIAAESLIGEVVDLEDLPDVLGGRRALKPGSGPKVQVRIRG